MFLQEAIYLYIMHICCNGELNGGLTGGPSTIGGCRKKQLLLPITQSLVPNYAK